MRESLVEISRNRNSNCNIPLSPMPIAVSIEISQSESWPFMYKQSNRVKKKISVVKDGKFRLKLCSKYSEHKD